MQGEAQGIMTETAGALVTASLFSKPAQWQSGNFPLNHRKEMVGNMACTRNHKKMYEEHLSLLCARKGMHKVHTQMNYRVTTAYTPFLFLQLLCLPALLSE